MSIFKPRQSPPVHTALCLDVLENRMMLSTVEILAAGFEGSEQMRLVIDGQAAQTWTVGDDPANLESYSYTSIQNFTAGDIRIEFLNDIWEPAENIDSNLVVDAIVVDGQRFETEDASVYSTGTWLPDDGIQPGFRQSEILHATGYLQFADPIETGSVIRVRARGSVGPEALDLLIDNEVVLSRANIGTAYRTFTYQADQSISIDQIRVAFTNDFNDGVVDHDLQLNWVEVDGARYQTESPTVYSTGTWKGSGVTPGYWESEILDINGYFDFGGAPETEILVRATGWSGEEDMELQIGGETVASWTSISDEGDDYRFSTNAIVSADDMRVVFTNDLYDELNGVDRNLIVDFISIDGVVYETESPTVFSNATWLPDDGIVPGYRESEWLHTDGYFQYSAADVQPGSFVLDSSYQIVAESDGEITVTINRINGTEGTVSIDYRTTQRTATAGDDFVSESGTLVFESGETSKTVTIEILADSLLEDAETFSFVIENPTGGAGLLSPRTSTIEITNDPGDGGNGPGDPELDLEADILTNVGGAVAIDWTPDGSTMFIGEFGGFIYVYRDGLLYSNPFVDISTQVNGTRGMLDIAVHPDFENTPYVYMAFAYDPPEVYENVGLAGPDGAGNRASRVIRVTADATNNYQTAVAGSEVVILGTNSVWENYNGFVDSTVDLDEPQGGVNPDGSYIDDFLAADSQSHTVNAIEFGPDGMLYVANGDGASYNSADPRALRVQDIDSLSGKILRIDPMTGEGLGDNPFYDGNVDANRAKVYQYGLRNPFRMTFDDAGQIYVGDVGWTASEEVNAGEAGANYGWPFYEGENPTPLYENLPEAIAFYNSNPDVTFGAFTMDHVDDEIDALIMGDFYDGDSLPDEYQGMLIFNHLGSGFVRGIEFDAAGEILSIRTLTEAPPFVTQIVTGPDGQLYFVDFGTGDIGIWSLTE